MDPKFNKKIGSYMLQKLIGSGSFAKVYKGLDTRNNETVAIKMISKQNLDPSKLSIIEKEINILRVLQHPNIIMIKDIKRTPNNIYLITDYCPLGDLEGYMEKYYYDKALKLYHMPEFVVQKVVTQLAQALTLMREKNIVHRDLKLANILVSKDFLIKLADFGFAKYQESTHMLLESYCGTPITMAPEILRKQTYNEKCDIWSLGVIIYKMLIGKYPFFPSGGGSLEDLIGVVEKGLLVFPSAPMVSEEVKELIKGMLRRSPESRMSFEEFFKHSWVIGLKGAENKGELDLKEALMSVYDKKKKLVNEEKKDQKEEGIKANIGENIIKIADNIVPDTINNEKIDNIVNNPNIDNENIVLSPIIEENTLVNSCKDIVKEQFIKEINMKSPIKDDNIDIEHISLDDLERKDPISLHKRFNKDFSDYFLLQMKSLLHRFSEIKAAIVLFAKEECPILQLFSFLLSLSTVKSLKEVLSNEITITFDSKVVIKKKLQWLLKGEEGILREIKGGFRELYGEIVLKVGQFQHVQEENLGPLLYKVFLEVVERNIVNEYVLDIRTLRESYRVLIEISGFLKRNYDNIGFSIKFQENEGVLNIEKAGEWFMEEIAEEGLDKGRLEIEEIGDYKGDYEEMEGIFYARMRQFDMDLIQ